MIKRDGFNTSIWQQAVTPYISIHNNAIPKHFDVCIVGGGITGISTALSLQLAGKSCLLLEAQNLGYGTTGGTTAHLNTLLDTPYHTIKSNFGKESASLVASSAAEALDFIRGNITRFAIDCGFEEASAYLFAQNETEEAELEKIAESSTDAGLVIEKVDKIPVPISFTSAIRAHNQAKFNPLEYIYGLASAFENAGGIIVQHTPVKTVQHGEPLEITTDTTAFTATDLVYATHIPPGVNLLHLRCAPYRSYAMAVRLKNNLYPQDLCYDMLDPYYYYRSQQVGRNLFLIAGGRDHKTGQEENTNKPFLELESHVRKYFDVAQVAFKWSSQYYEPVDGLPYIGHLPGTPEHVFVATGFGGNGMIYSSVAAGFLTDLICGQQNRYENLFDPNRIKPVAGFVNFLQHNTDVVKHYLGRILPSESLPQLAGLAAGEGRVVKFEGQHVAIHKDDQGNIHAVHPVCTHLKCEVCWNATEQSWDCPCHGARYDVNGKVLNTPADIDLERVEIH